MKDLVDLFQIGLSMDDVDFDGCNDVADINAAVEATFNSQPLDGSCIFIPHLVSEHNLASTIIGRQRKTRRREYGETKEVQKDDQAAD